MDSSQSPAEQVSFPHKLTRLITWLYLLRFPILTGLFMVLLPIVAFHRSAKALLENLFDLGVYEILLISTTAFLAAWSVMVTAGLTRNYARRRFGLDFGREEVEGRSHVAGFGLLAAPIIIGILWKAYQQTVESPPEPKGTLWIKSAMVVSGFLLALLLLIIAGWIQRRVNSPITNEQAPGLLLSLKTPVIGEALARANKRPSLPAPAGSLPAWLCKFGGLVKKIPPFWGNGYIDYDADPNKRFPLLPGHGAAFSLAFMCVSFYAFVGIAAAPSFRWFQTPALAYLVILITLLNWLLSCLAFFLDRYRAPATLVIIAWLALSARVFTRTDSYFYIYKEKEPPARVVSSPCQRDDSRIIVVAANGGGIQSAAWTAYVLNGLTQIGRELNKESGNAVSPDGNCRGIDFAKQVRLISAVSGGSLGAMYFADAYGPNCGVTEEDGKNAFNLASRSSLNGVAWGLVFPDFVRRLMPLATWKMDRGSALELDWKRALYGPGEKESLRGMLSDWRWDAKAGKRPGVIFNATIVDSGRPLLFTTLDFAKQTFPTKDPVKPREADEVNKMCQPEPAADTGGNAKREVEEVQAEIFAQMPRYKGYDIPITTAVRLSATFPYVTPAARAQRYETDDWRTPEYHVVDGGYYDNYGMASLVAWLDAELRWANRPIKNVLIIRIYGAPIGGLTKPEEGRGWLYQTLAPVLTLNSVRGAGQLTHSTIESELLKRYYGAQNKEKSVDIELVTFAYPDSNTPLSWHLTQSQIQNIKSAWEVMNNKEHSNIKHVKCFLSGRKFDGNKCN
jgi:Patatin-like phospholipase